MWTLKKTFLKKRKRKGRSVMSGREKWILDRLIVVFKRAKGKPVKVVVSWESEDPWGKSRSTMGQCYPIQMASGKPGQRGRMCPVWQRKKCWCPHHHPFSTGQSLRLYTFLSIKMGSNIFIFLFSKYLYKISKANIKIQANMKRKKGGR